MRRTSVLLFTMIGCQPAGPAPASQGNDTPKQLKQMEETLDHMEETLTALHEEVAGLREDMGSVLSKLDGAEAEVVEASETLALDVSEVRCTDNVCTVPLSVTRAALEDPEVLIRQARIVLSQRDGRTVGFKILGIRRGSLPAALGMENGDVIMKVNGKALDGLDSGMKALVGLGAGGEFRLDIERGGKAMTQILNVKGEPAN